VTDGKARCSGWSPVARTCGCRCIACIGWERGRSSSASALADFSAPPASQLYSTSAAPHSLLRVLLLCSPFFPVSGVRAELGS
jgi:hypothetical protein